MGQHFVDYNDTVVFDNTIVPVIESWYTRMYLKEKVERWKKRKTFIIRTRRKVRDIFNKIRRKLGISNKSERLFNRTLSAIEREYNQII